ncbi:MFS transporter [Paraflavitalea soli]|uniref:MFS transporter n=1 Tax=Paraflavitalea soli TaxID=2315862 RepID=A0A3B7MVN0_9BACT|nr:sugar porter family MFS transporter [Paraflavitalea soli]AXY77997.1 MFS transporter [Paraflavitalea soli]
MQTTRYPFQHGYILALSFISALGGYLFGFDFAVISGALPFLKEQFSFNEYWEGFATASLALGCVIGCIVAGTAADKYGRRPGLMIAAFIFLVSSLAMAFSATRGVFISARFVAGIGVGMASMLSPLYIAEIAPAKIRGRMVAINQLTIVIGILITNIVNYSLRDHGPDAWRWMVGLGAVPSLLFLVGVAWLPESPRWLLTRGRDQKAANILSRIGGTDYARDTMQSMANTVKSMVKVNYASVLEKSVLPAVVIGIGLAVFQQFCGINVVFNFATTIFESVGFSQDDQLKQTVFVGIINLVFTFLAMWQVDKLGRKPLMLFGAAALAVLYLVSAFLLQQRSPAAAWSLLAAIATYAMSLAPVTWVLISEIFPDKVRGVATSVAVISLWLSYALLVFTFPILARKMGAFTPFYIYAGICVAGCWFVWRKVKETKGKSLEELENIFTGH